MSARVSAWSVFREHPRITLRGTVADTLPLYASHRVFVAPTRYAAGLPYKVNEAASFGLPVVATELLRGQLGWTDGEDILAAPAADPALFAALSWRCIATRRCGDASAPAGWRGSRGRTAGSITSGRLTDILG